MSEEMESPREAEVEATATEASVEEAETRNRRPTQVETKATPSEKALPQSAARREEDWAAYGKDMKDETIIFPNLKQKHGKSSQPHLNVQRRHYELILAQGRDK